MLGALTLSSKGTVQRTREEIELIQLVATHLALAIDRQLKEVALFSAYEELDERVKEQTTELRVAYQSLKESEANYHGLYENAPDMFALVDHKTGMIKQCNLEFARVMGYRKEELIGRPVADVYPSDSMEDVRRLSESLVTTNVVHNRELQLRRKDGTRIDVSLSVSAVLDERGDVLHSSCIWRDITERKRAAEVLRESEERFRRIFDHSNDPIFVIDLSRDRILDVNAKACDMLEYAYEELLATPISTIHPGEMGNLVAFSETVLERGEGWTDQVACLTKSGRKLDTEMSASVMAVDGRTCIVVLVRDVTQRRRLERQERIVQRAREEVWQMRKADDILQVIKAIGAGLKSLEVACEYYGINIVDESSDPPTVRCHGLSAEGEMSVAESRPEESVVLRIWRKGVTAYRRDLQAEDVYQERSRVCDLFHSPVRSLLDLPFSHGTLAVGSPEPAAFSDQDITILQELTAVLEEGFRRLDDLKALSELRSNSV